MEIYAAMSRMVRAGLITCNRSDPDGTITYGADTVLAPAHMVLQ